MSRVAWTLYNAVAGRLTTGMKQKLRINLSRPEKSFMGRLVTRLFVRHNAILEEAAVDLLDIQPNDNVLEIGFGPGVGLLAVYDRVKDGDGVVFGVDYSKYMLERATKRCIAEIQDNKIQLHCTSVDRLPFPSDFIDGIYHCNCYYFWPNRRAACTELLRVLRPGSRMVTTLSMERLKYANSHNVLPESRTDPLSYMMSLEKAGFVDIEIKYFKTSEDERNAVSYEAILARKPTVEELQALTDEQDEIDPDRSERLMEKLKEEVMRTKKVVTVIKVQRPQPDNRPRTMTTTDTVDDRNKDS